MKANSLYETFSSGNLHFKNRIAMAPMTRGRAGDERIPNELMAEHYFQRASAGLIIYSSGIAAGLHTVIFITVNFQFPLPP